MTGIEPATSTLQRRALDQLSYICNESLRSDSNRLPSPYRGDAQPDELRRRSAPGRIRTDTVRYLKAVPICQLGYRGGVEGNTRDLSMGGAGLSP